MICRLWWDRNPGGSTDGSHIRDQWPKTDDHTHREWEFQVLRWCANSGPIPQGDNAWKCPVLGCNWINSQVSPQTFRKQYVNLGCKVSCHFHWLKKNMILEIILSSSLLMLRSNFLFSTYLSNMNCNYAHKIQMPLALLFFFLDLQMVCHQWFHCQS